MLVTGARGARAEWNGQTLGVPGQSCALGSLAVWGALSTLKPSKEAKELFQLQVHKDPSLITLFFPDFFKLKKKYKSKLIFISWYSFFLMGLVQLLAAVTLHFLPIIFSQAKT